MDDSRKEFYEALGKFQASCPNIPKTKEVLNRDGKTVRYRYAPLDSIIKLIREPLQKHGFTYRWDIVTAEDGPSVTCYLTHIGGHQESSTFHVPRYAGYGTNKAQDEASANTFGKRYSLANVLGLVIDEDDDGAGASQPNSEFLVHHNNTARKWLPSILACKDALAQGDKDAAAEVIAEMPLKVFKTLWVAPSNGGFWTTEERKLMKEDGEFRDLVHQRRRESGWYDLEENQI